MSVSRPAVRVVCIDDDFRVLLLRWRDPVSGSMLWEGPGGDVEAGETPFDAACRELEEETGLRDARVGGRSVVVTRDVWWAGCHLDGVEEFFVARVSDTTTGERRLSGHELVSLVGESWFTWDEICLLDEPIEPPNLREVLSDLVPEGPWSSVQD
jgi:8-oxo-dGTP pyrophosphatase MutT (NUDIX family)